MAPALAGDAPPATRSPGAYEVLVVEDLTAQGYLVPAIIDEAGNNNGLVCGKPLPRWQQKIFCKKFGPCHVPIIYNFVDDSEFLPRDVATSV